MAEKVLEIFISHAIIIGRPAINESHNGCCYFRHKKTGWKQRRPLQDTPAGRTHCAKALGFYCEAGIDIADLYGTYLQHGFNPSLCEGHRAKGCCHHKDNSCFPHAPVRWRRL